MEPWGSFPVPAAALEAEKKRVTPVFAICNPVPENVSELIP